MHQERRRARAVLGSAEATRARKPNDPAAAKAADEARRDYWAVALEEHVTEIVAAAPPFSYEQRTRIAAALRAGGA